MNRFSELLHGLSLSQIGQREVVRTSMFVYRHPLSPDRYRRCPVTASTNFEIVLLDVVVASSDILDSIIRKKTPTCHKCRGRYTFLDEKSKIAYSTEEK